MKLNKELEKKLKNLAYESRILTAKAFHESGMGGHYGGSFSSADILTVLYNGILKIDPKNPNWEERDNFILSKGHAAAMLASVLAFRGFFDKNDLMKYDQLDSAYGMHTTLKIPGVELAAGSLGHGLSFSLGIALEKKLSNKTSRVFVLLGDGEINAGPVWEAAMSAGKYQLDNLIAIIDRNMCNMEGDTETIMPLEPLEDKWRSFGWSVKTVDGHNVSELFETLSSVPFEKGKPTCIIAKTVKGKGVSYMEGKYNFHHANLSDQDYQSCVECLKKNYVNRRNII
jgi:transketolase